MNCETFYKEPWQTEVTAAISRPMTWQIAAFYEFARLPHYRALQAPLLRSLADHRCKGSVLLADEGVNGTIAAPAGQIDHVLDGLRNVTGLALKEVKFSAAAAQPFKRLKVRLKREIVTMGKAYADPGEMVGTYVEPRDWNALISDPEVILIDARNAYEFKVGTFQNAIDPGTGSFGEFPDWARRALADKKGRRIAMFCTGGIRCEKATSFLKHEGFEQVFHLKGGILKYLETIPAAQSLWNGGCFVFDERVAVGHGLAETGHSICHGCIMPVSPEERISATYEEGVCCPACVGKLNEAQKASNRERQRQFVLAQKRGTRHLGPVED